MNRLLRVILTLQHVVLVIGLYENNGRLMAVLVAGASSAGVGKGVVPVATGMSVSIRVMMKS